MESGESFRTRIIAGLEVDVNLVGDQSVLKLGAKAGPEDDDGVRRVDGVRKVVPNSVNSWTRSRRERCRSPESPQTWLKLDQKLTMVSGESTRILMKAGEELKAGLKSAGILMQSKKFHNQFVT